MECISSVQDQISLVTACISGVQENNSIVKGSKSVLKDCKDHGKDAISAVTAGISSLAEPFSIMTARISGGTAGISHSTYLNAQGSKADSSPKIPSSGHTAGISCQTARISGQSKVKG